ncbi:type IV toxin-antitoxin system AbiEi family antitoxin [Marivirga salinae]|uniref:Type IV toxin-antitoxin system AbiEi family antitoxin n=1 Tax=Marivirga salinarum TaxID=3059078 RepID=A0AA51R9Y9_9BACT|nr:type IV toxin-antitoxin system AbiEi family antitoxin [Marivirga sp. BDSF4-3]WMN12692.1 type IV toxin-antitoxin system AbiEi family antitoxin [Marivirga sp. BDSF4-3]
MENEIINIALNNVHQNVPIQLKYKKTGQYGGFLTATKGKEELWFYVMQKGEVRKYVVEELEDIKQPPVGVMLIAERIPANIKAALRKRKTAYIEGNGNIYIENENMFVFVDSNKTLKLNKEKGNRAFTKTGLKVLLHFLIKPELVNQTQREIAEYTGVGLGNIPQVIEGLKETGYLLRLNKKEYAWENRKDLFFRWIEGYQTILKPTLKKRRFQMRKKWQEIALNDGIAAWGGESAADLLTNYLRPEKFILYTNEDQANLIRNYNFQPKKDGDLEVIEMFWNKDLNQRTAPPIIVYADLMMEGGKRNQETAEMIYNEQIQPNL